MKKFLILAIVFLASIWAFWSYSFAAGTGTAASSVTKITVTENIPWMDCKLKTWAGWGDTVTTRKYVCEIGWNFWAVMLMLKGMIKYVTFLSILVAVLMLVLSGLKMSLEWKKDDKKMFKRVLVALLVLFSMGLILNSIAPWIYI
ncbi:MAG: hypothetical protein ACD_3C00196G0021 [uncultured bacterium (gcode 4)]|uniref:Uncharacterized protein n=1 Tax=uncultured bacterium (gcode 4) TaxID=1234023 RepID=K2FX52_9BACT|nr:MAG: hypothetical protein ACD_3C00196G0021 [uncultured bacterium (gcode 4)]